MNPLVSIGVPIYNVESYIERCARSLFEQTYVNIEYIFIDDNFKNCKEASNLGVRTLLMDSRLNKNLNDEKIKRVFSWNDIERDLI